MNATPSTPFPLMAKAPETPEDMKKQCVECYFRCIALWWCSGNSEAMETEKNNGTGARAGARRWGCYWGNVV